MKNIIFFGALAALLPGCTSLSQPDKIAATEKCEAVFSDIERESCLQTLSATNDYAAYRSAAELADKHAADREQKARELAIGGPEKNAGGFKIPRKDED